MNKWVAKGLIFLGYSMPYGYLALNDDVSNDSMIFYGIMVVVLLILTLISTRTNNIMVLIMGNLVSFIISYFLVMSHQTEEWSWYFKPFSAIGMLVFVSSISWALQITYTLYYKLKSLRGENKN